MALPEPKTLVKDFVPKCCKDPELKKWLDDIKAIRDAGNSTESIKKIAQYARENGHRISTDTILRHFRGECGTS